MVWRQRQADRRGTYHDAVPRGVVAHVRRYFGVSHSRVREALSQYDPNAEGLSAKHVELDATELDRKSNPKKTVIPATAIDGARSHVRQSLAAGTTLTWGEVAKYLRESHGVVATDAAVRRRLTAHGFAVLQTRSKPPIDLTTDYWTRQRERFVVEMAVAWQQEQEDQAVVVWMDESFVHLHHHRNKTVADLTNTTQISQERRAKPKALLSVGADRGRLQIVVHALTRDGLLHPRDANGKYIRGDAINTATTAEVVYAARGKNGGKDDDALTYHHHWDSASFLRWVKVQLLPAFSALYPGRAMVLVLDNSANHSARPSSYVPPNSAKPLLAGVLTANGIHSFRVDRGEITVPAQREVKARRGRPAPGRAAVPEHTRRDERTFDSDQWETAAPRGPSAKELADRVRLLYEAVPHLTQSSLERLFLLGVRTRWHSISLRCRLLILYCANCQCSAGDDRDLPNGLPAAQHRVLWTIPYESLSNPIEQVWARAKGHAAAVGSSKSTLTSVADALRDGFYGTAAGTDGRECAGVTTGFAANVIRSNYHFIERLTRESVRLSAITTSFAALGAVAVALYGPIARAHRTVRRRKAVAAVAAAAADDDDDGDDDDDDAEEVEAGAADSVDDTVVLA